MTTFKQITKKEWQSGDYRPGAMIHRKAEVLFPNHLIDFFEHLVEGLGKAKSAFFLTSNNRQFAVTEYLEPSIPITEIIILINADTINNDLNEVLEILGLNYSDLDFVYKY